MSTLRVIPCMPERWLWTVCSSLFPRGQQLSSAWIHNSKWCSQIQICSFSYRYGSDIQYLELWHSFVYFKGSYAYGGQCNCHVDFSVIALNMRQHWRSPSNGDKPKVHCLFSLVKCPSHTFSVLGTQKTRVQYPFVELESKKRACWSQLPHMEATKHKDLWCFGCRPNWVHMFLKRDV